MFLNTDALQSNEIKLVLTKTSVADPIKEFVPAYYFDICLLNDTIQWLGKLICV